MDRRTARKPGIQMIKAGLILLLGIGLSACDDSPGPEKPGSENKSVDAKTGKQSDTRQSGPAGGGSERKQAGQENARQDFANRRPGGRAREGSPRGSGPRGGAGSRGNMSQFQDRPVPVAVTTVLRGRVDAYYATTGSLTAENEASVVARTQGVVEDIFVEESDLVKAGDPLAQLDTRRLELEVIRTRTNIESFERAYTRARQLLDKSMISPEVYDQALYNLERENATLALQLYELEEATIRAPINGVITLRHIKLGNTLSPNMAAFELKQADTIEAVLNVPEKELIKIAVGQLAIVRLDALNDQDFEGVVKRVAPEVDAGSGTFRVTVALSNPDNRLKPGMFARVRIRYDSNENTLLVNREAVVTQQDGNTVFVVRGGLATRQSVTLGHAMDREVEILEGLGEGDEVVVTGQGGLKDGASVRVVTL